MTDMFDARAVRALLPGFVPLVEDAQAYFTNFETAKMLPIDQLHLSRLRPEGVINAYGLMAAAARGEIEKRTPISVARRAAGGWNVRDGNSTVAIARLSCWQTIPCQAET